MVAPMIFHRLALFVRTSLAGRHPSESEARREALEGARGIPSGPAEIEAAAAEAGFSIPDPCMPGVIANLELLGRHAEILLGAMSTAGR